MPFCLAGGDQPLPQRVGARARVPILDRGPVVLRPGRAGMVARRHRSSPTSPSAGAAAPLTSRRSTWRAFEPSNAPM